MEKKETSPENRYRKILNRIDFLREKIRLCNEGILVPLESYSDMVKELMSLKRKMIRCPKNIKSRL